MSQKSRISEKLGFQGHLTYLHCVFSGGGQRASLDKLKARKPPLWAMNMHDYSYLFDIKLFEAFKAADPEEKRELPVQTFLDILTAMKVPLPPSGEGDDPKVLKTFLPSRPTRSAAGT